MRIYSNDVNEEHFQSRDWAYTLKISPGAPAIFEDDIPLDNEEEKYPQNKKLVRYRDLRVMDQEQMIKQVLQVIPIKYHVTCFYELHADGRTHAHGTVYEASRANMEYFRHAINRTLGYKLDNPNMFHFKKIKDSVGWDAYCKKHQKILEDEEGVDDEAVLPDKVYDTNVFKTPHPNNK